MAWVNIEDNRKWHREWAKKKYHEDPEYREKRKKQQRDRLVHSLEVFDSKFGGVMYEEYRIKEEDEKRSPEIMYGTQNEPTPPTPEELKKYHKQRPGTKGRR